MSRLERAAWALLHHLEHAQLDVLRERSAWPRGSLGYAACTVRAGLHELGRSVCSVVLGVSVQRRRF